MKTISKNLVQLTGHLGNDVQILQIANGSKKASFSLAVNSSYTSAGGETKKETSWFNIVAWGKTAETMAESLKKGQEVGIEGKIVSRKYTDKNGVTRYIIEIVVAQFYQVEKSEKEGVAVIAAEY